MKDSNSNTPVNASDFPPLTNDRTDENLLIYVILGSCISIFGTFSNLLFILSFFKQKRLRTVSYYILGYLALVDMLLCCLSIPWSLRVTAGTTSVVSCQLEANLTFFLAHLSVQAQCLTSCNRYFLVTKPRFVYNKWFTRRRVLLYIVGGWIFAITSAVLVNSFTEMHKTTEYCSSRTDVIDTKKVNNYILSLLIFIYFVIAVGFYGSLIKFLRQNSLRLDLEKRRESKTSVALFFLLCVFFISFFASPLTLYIHSFFKEDRTHMDTVDQIVACILLMNYCLNPVCYGFRIKEFKEELKNTVFCCLPSRVHVADEVHGAFVFTLTRRNEAERDP